MGTMSDRHNNHTDPLDQRSKILNQMKLISEVSRVLVTDRQTFAILKSLSRLKTVNNTFDLEIWPNG